MSVKFEHDHPPLAEGKSGCFSRVSLIDVCAKEGSMVFWIIGAGKFGSRAVRFLTKEYPEARITLVDSDRYALADWQGRVATVWDDGVTFLVRQLNETEARTVPDWIVPAIPVHVAFEWLRHTLAKRFDITSVPVPDAFGSLLPHPVRGSKGELYVSHATFMCPEDCPEPPDVCMATGEPRKTDVYKMLEQTIFAEHTSVVVRSRQLAPGVGGYPAQALLNARVKVSRSEGRVLMGTACRCHGVVHAFRIVKN
ncbi:MAG: potassium transporter [Desulfobacterales bacterium]|nr:MAG: potassium transporter [Desulfobacterales bacterium]